MKNKYLKITVVLLLLCGISSAQMPISKEQYYKLNQTVYAIKELYVDTVNQYKTHMPLDVALIEAGATRIRPILLTTLTTVISMIPMALGYGNDMLQGLALVNVGGLIASTLLSLLLLPTLYKMIDKAGRSATGESLTEGLDID